VLAVGGAGAYLPYHVTWVAERVEELPSAAGRFFHLQTLHDLREVIATLEA
jgi:putative hydrolase of the HAD superfamily